MKILLQHRQNKFFFRRLQVWTSDSQTAYDFERTSRAIEFARAHDLAQVQLVIKFADPECDQIVPLPDPVRETRQLGLFWDCDEAGASVPERTHAFA
jgi:hypothetical protein